MPILPAMRVLIVHNQLWAHYKSKLFSELHRLAPLYGAEVYVLQIALSEKSRANMGEAAAFKYDYNYEVLFNTSLDQVPLWPRTKALLKKTRDYKPDVLNLTGWYDPAQWVLLFYAKLSGIKIVISNESNVRDYVRMGLKERFKQALLAMADGFFCFGKSSGDYLKKLGVESSQIFTEKAAVVDNSVILNRYRETVVQKETLKKQKGWARYNFIFVGRLIAPKNLPLLIDAFAEISKLTSDWGLIFLGEGEEKEELMQRAQTLTNVKFEAGVPWFEVADYMTLADVLVLPSYLEPWGLIVNEAMICGLPVLVSERAGCIEDLVQVGQNGFTFDPYQKEDLVAKMRYFVKNTGELDRMGKNSQRIVAPFDSEKVAREMLQGMKSLL
ncbi:MAG: glycosyltransferase family 4 protein [Spirosomataceae bacterium]